MFVLGDFKNSADDLLLEVIKIICTEMNRDDISPGFRSHTEEAGRRTMEYLWHSGAIVIKKDPVGQVTLNDLIDENKR